MLMLPQACCKVHDRLAPPEYLSNMSLITAAFLRQLNLELLFCVTRLPVRYEPLTWLRRFLGQHGLKLNDEWMRVDT